MARGTSILHYNGTDANAAALTTLAAGELAVGTDAGTLYTKSSGSSASVKIADKAAFASGAANQFWATPNGSSGAPSLRAIVAADIPVGISTATGVQRRLGANQSLPVVSTYALGTVLWDTAVRNDSDITYNSSTGVFTINTAGYYAIKSSVTFASGYSGTYAIWVLWNGTTRSSETAEQGTGPSLVVADLGYLSAGDTISIGAYASNSSAGTLIYNDGSDGSDMCNVSIVKLVGGSGALASVTNTDLSLTITTAAGGAVTASLNTAHANTWSALQTFSTFASTGLCTKYNGDTTAGNGLASVVAKVEMFGQTGAIAATTLFTTPAAGLYEVSVYTLLTVAASGTPTITIAWTDDYGAQTLNATGGLSVAAGSYKTTVNLLRCTASTAIKYSQGTATTSTYNFHVVLKRLS